MLKTWPIGRRLALALLLPIAGMLLFSATLVVERWQARSEALHLAPAASFAKVVSGLVHELQKERGNSAGFLGSKGQSFREQLAEQRRASDTALTLFKSATAQLDEPALAGSISAAQTSLERLASIRGQVDGLSIEPKAAIGFYTETIGKLLDTVSPLAKMVQHKELGDITAAYLALMQGKERAGIERATGSAGFGAGQFSPELHQRLVALGAAQDAFFSSFRASAAPALAAKFDEAMANPAVAEVLRLRKIAYDSPVTNDLGGVTGPQWFKATTARIELLKAAEDAVAAALAELADSIASGATGALLLTLLSAAALSGVAILLALVIGRGVTRPLHSLSQTMLSLAQGNTAVTIEGCDRGDEVGEMSRAVEVFRENRIRADRLDAEHRQDEQAREQRRAAMDGHVRQFDEAVRHVLGALSNATGQLKSAANTFSDTARDTGERSSAAAAAALQASHSVESITASVTQLSNAVADISSRIDESVHLTRESVERANRTNEIVTSLSTNATRIGEVVSFINDIASQTNLLALNATIEAARAGEAGKGFAVVAAEVKSLANQTAKATEDIASQAAAVQASSREAADALAGIGGAIGRLNEMVGAIAHAVDEQGRATAHMAASMHQAAEGTRDVTANVAGVNEAARRNGSAAISANDAISALSSEAEELGSQVEKFLGEMRRLR